MILNAPPNEQQTPLKHGENEIKIISEFKYLGSLMSSSANDMQCRKGQAWGAFWKLEKIWRSKSIQIRTKVRIFQAAIISILLYGSETWVITKEQMKSLDSFATN